MFAKVHTLHEFHETEFDEWCRAVGLSVCLDAWCSDERLLGYVSASFTDGWLVRWFGWLLARLLASLWHSCLTSLKFITKYMNRFLSAGGDRGNFVEY